MTEDSGGTTLTASGAISIWSLFFWNSAFRPNVISYAGNLGTLTISSNGNYAYSVANSLTQYLGAGQTKVDTFIITALDGTQKAVSFTIYGVNDAAVIGTPTVSSVTEDQSATTLIASGNISITDVDQGQAAFKTTVSSASGNLGTLVLASTGAYTYSVANSLTQSLGAGDTKVDTFTITAVDGTTKQVQFTINGKNDVAVIGGVSSGLVKEDVAVSSGNLTTSGSLTIADVDAGQSNFAPQATTLGSNGLGTFTLAANGTWTYKALNAQAAIQGLAADETLTDSFTAVSSDGSASKVVTVTINGANDVTYVVGGTVDPSATKGGLGVEIYNGAGIPPTGFGLANQTDVGVQLGWQIAYRQGPVVTTSDTYADGVLHYTVNDGAQSIANGSQANQANRAAWSFNYSIATGLGGESGTLANYTFKLKFDIDPTVNVTYKTLTLAPGGGGTSGYKWVDENNVTVIGDDAGTATVTQNSQNYAFYSALLNGAYNQANNFDGPATFDLILQASRNNVVLAENHVVVDVIETNAAPPVIQNVNLKGVAFENGDLDAVRQANVAPNYSFEPNVNVDAVILAALNNDPSTPMQTVLSAVQTALGSGAKLPDAIAAVWDFVDDNYSYYNTVINEISARLSVEYAKYLKAGGKPLLDVVAKFAPDGARADINGGVANGTPDRLQSLHDNILGNLSIAGLNDKFLGAPQFPGGPQGSNPNPDPVAYQEIIDLLAANGLSDLVNRPYYSGDEGSVNAALAYDKANGFAPVASGQLSATDPDNGPQPLTWSGSATSAYGSFVISSSGAWTYTLNQTGAANGLAEGAVVLDKFTVSVSDGSDIVSDIVTITINGANDAPSDIRHAGNAALAAGSSIGFTTIAANANLFNLSGVDPDGPTPFSYGFGNGTTSDNVTIGGASKMLSMNASTGAVTATSALSFNTVQSVDVATKVTDALGASRPETVTLKLGLNGVNDTIDASLATNDQVMYGFTGNDTLKGGAASDWINGGGGDDNIYGNGGADVLIGQAGADRFHYLSVSDSAPGAADLIADLVIAGGVDKINVSAIDSNPTVINDNAFLWGGANANTVANSATYSYDALANETIVKFDNTGDTNADMVIRLTGNLALTSADFIL